ncbi:hypothetical protein KM043_001484 [Ampulex compressa]|nr:hypothetical protein KM043_001484 [Ampulex compressa]
MKSELLCTDVLAIRCIDDFLLVGVGCTLLVLQRDTHELQAKLRCLYPNNVHGIVEGPNRTLATFGANSLCIYRINAVEGRAVLHRYSNVCRFDDWIIALEWLTVHGQTYLLILFAHNNLYIYDILHRSYNNVQCEEKCILYGGSISVNENKDVIIFSGTVFQEILIWEVKHYHDNQKRCPILHRLKGHNGVIFSVIFDPVTSLICSTSDDRTVRLWRVMDPNNSEKRNVNWKHKQVKLTKTMFGHSARVWRVIMKNDLLITIGEDSLICTWSLDGKLMNKTYAHNGAAIWSIDAFSDNQGMYTGGGDGAVCMWPFMNSSDQKTISLPGHPLHKVPKYICCLCNGTVLIFHEGGTITCCNKEKYYRKDSVYLQKYSNYCIMQVSPCRTYVSFASGDGYVIIYKEANEGSEEPLLRVFEKKIMESKIFSLHWLKSNVIIVCGENGHLNVFTFTIDGSFHTQSKYLLPQRKERWLTAAILHDQLLICGDRSGDMIGIQVFFLMDAKLATAGRDGTLRFYKVDNEKKEEPLCILHGKKMPMDWISGTLKTEKDTFVVGFKELEFIIYSMRLQRILARIPCGGGHRSWDFMLLKDLITFAYIRNKRVFILNHSMYSSNFPVVLNGFHTKEVYCMLPIMEINGQYVFISGGEDCSLRLTLISHTLQTNGCVHRTLGVFDGHISNIKCFAVMNLKQNSTSGKYLIFSGGGRAQLKAWEILINHGEENIRSSDVYVRDIKSHMLYGEDQLRKKPWLDSQQAYIVNPETRYMDVTVCPTQCSNIVLLVAACADGCLRIFSYNTATTNFHLKMCIKHKDRCILKTHVISSINHTLALTMSTDGVVRFQDLTKIVLKACENLWDINVDFENINTVPLAECKLHQSGINSFDLNVISESEYLLATGGDDNSLSLMVFKIHEPKKHESLSISILSKWSTKSAHSAQITGVKFANEDKFCSVGMDQQVITYKYVHSSGTLSVEILNRVFTSVPDVQGMTLTSLERCSKTVACIYGKGFEIFVI